MSHNCETCAWFCPGARPECMYNPPTPHGYPQVKPERHCHHHTEISQIIAKRSRKRKAAAAETESFAKRDDLVGGEYDHVEPSEHVLRGLMEVLGRTQGMKVYGLSKKRRDVVLEAIREHSVSTYAKACEGWQHIPYWSGSERGQEAKNPDPIKVAQHIEKFCDAWERARDVDKGDPSWLINGT